MSCGIYKITNQVNGKSYIGMSQDIESRWKHHEWEATNPKQAAYNYTIHQAFRKYGFSNFIYEIIEETTPDKLPEREIYWIEYFDTYNNGYNETEGGDRGPVCAGEKNGRARLTEEDVRAIRQSILDGRFQQEVYDEDGYESKISFRQFQRIWRGEGWEGICPEAVAYVKTQEYLSKVRSHARQCQGTMKKALENREAILARKEKGEARLEVYEDYKNEYSLSGFNKVWYYK